MVKVQKPKPKTLSKLSKVESSLKKKKLVGQNIKSAGDAVSVPDISPTAPKKKQKKLKETIDAKAVLSNVKELKKNNVNLNNQKNLKKSSQSRETTKPKKEKKPIEAATTRRPGVTAPPESPVPFPKAIEGKAKGKKAKASNAQATPSTNLNVKKSKKKNKKQGKAANKDVEAKPQPELTKAQKRKAAIKAYKKQKLQKKLKGKEKKARDGKIKQTFEPVPFDEDKFKAILSVENIKKIAKALKAQAEKEVAEKKSSIFSDYQYILNVASFKIPSCPKRMVKLSLKHSLVDKEDEVVIIVPDLQRGAKVDYEPTIQHYEDIFREAGVEGLKIMPFNQLKKECGNFEAVRKFGNTYDYFLCDGRLVGQVAGFCGKVFQKPRTTFHAVRLDNPKNIKNEIEKSLRRTAYKQLAKGDLISIPVGNHKYRIQELAENIDHVIGNLKTLYPGGLANVRSMNLKINIAGTSSLPLYISMGQVPPETPYVVGTREQRMLKMKKEANEVLSRFAMTKDAEIVKLTKDQVETKRKIKETKAALAAQAANKDANDNDGEESAVPAKRAKKEEKVEVEKDLKKKSSEEQAEPQDDSDEDPDEDSDESDEEVGDGDDDEDDDDDDNDNDDDEGNAEVDDGDDDDDDGDDDDEDEDGDDDEDEEGDDSD